MKLSKKLFLLLLLTSIITQFGFSEEEEDNKKECSVAISGCSLPSEATGGKVYKDNKAFKITDGTFSCACGESGKATPDVSSIGGGPGHYTGTVTWSASCDGDAKTQTKKYDFWVFKFDGIPSNDLIKFLSSDSKSFIQERIESAAKTTLTPVDMPFQITISGNSPDQEEFSNWTAQMKSNKTIIGTTFGFKVYNANWLVYSQKNEDDVPETVISSDTKKTNHWFDEGYETRIEKVILDKCYDHDVSTTITDSPTIGIESVTATMSETSQKFEIGGKFRIGTDKDKLGFELGLTYTINVVTKENKQKSVSIKQVAKGILHKYKCFQATRSGKATWSTSDYTPAHTIWDGTANMSKTIPARYENDSDSTSIEDIFVDDYKYTTYFKHARLKSSDE